MAYISMDDYIGTYHAMTDIPQELFDSIAERASDIIDELTMGRVAQIGLENLSQFDRRQVIKACCAQAEHIAMVGATAVVTGASPIMYTVGSTTVTMSEATTQKAVSRLAVKFLEPTGLMYRGAVCSY